MRYTEGDLRAAEHFIDTTVFMYYYRIRQKAAYITWHNEQMKEQMKG